MHPWAWGAWLAGALVALSVTRNPLYLLLIWLCLLLVAQAWRTAGPGDASAAAGRLRPISPFKFALLVIGLAALFNAFTSHVGQTRLFTIPGRLPLFSGPVTLEGVVYGAINGLALAGMFAAFALLNQVLPVQSLVRMIPRTYYPVAVIASIAVTYVPTTLRQFQQVREAQAVRGHRLRGLRDWLPLLVPLLVSGLEHALQLAEAMTARGFASQPTQPGTARRAWLSPRLAILPGMLLLMGGWLLDLTGYGGPLGGVLAAGGAALVLGGLWAMGRSMPRSSYRRWRWSAWDSLACFGVLLVLAAYLQPAAQDGLWYSPYPALALPPFNPWLGVATLGLLAPAILTFLPWLRQADPV